MRWADVWQALKAISRGDTQTISMFPLLDQAAPSSPADGSHGGRLHLETRQFGGPHPHSQRVWVAGDAPAAGDAPNRSTMADRIVSFARGLSPRNRLRFDEALEGALDLGALPDVGALEHLQGASHADIYEAAELLHLDRSLPDGGPERTDALQPPTSEVLKRRWHPHMAIKGPMSSAPDEVLEALAQRPDEHIISHIAEEVANGRGIQVLGPAHRLNAVESARLRADYQAHREARIASEENDKARRAEATQRANAERVRSQAERKAERFGLPLARDLVHFAVEKARQGWTIKLVPGAFKDEPFTVEQEPPSRFGLPAPVMHPMDRVLAYCPTRTRTQALRSARALQHDVDTNSRISLKTQTALADILAAGEGQEWASSPEPGADALKAGPIANQPGLHLDPTSHRWTRDVERVIGEADVSGKLREEIGPAAGRAIAAGAHPGSLRYMNAGAEGVLFRDQTGRVFKVGRHHGKRDIWGDVARNHLESEADAGRVLAEHGLAPRVHDYNREHDVIVRDHVDGRQGAWSDSRRLQDVHEKVTAALDAEGFTRPEFKEDSYVVGDGGDAKLVDVGFTHPKGKRLAAKLRAMDITPDSPGQFNIQLDIAHAHEDGAISDDEARGLMSKLGPEMKEHGLGIISGRVKNALKAGPIANRPGLHLDPASHRWTRDVGATLDHIRAAHFEHTRDEGIAAKMPHVRVHQHNPRMGYKGRPPSHLAAAHHEVAGGHTVASALHGAMSVLPFHPSKAEAWDRAQHRYHHAVAAEAWAHVSDKEDQASAREKSKRAEEWDRVIKSRYPTDRARGGRDANDRRTVDLEDLIAMKEAAKAGPIANRPGLHFDATRHRWVANVEHLSGDRQLDKIMREIHQEKADHRNRVLGHMAKGTIEFREPRSDRHALIVPDASEPGRWRFSRFDSGGFAGHRTYDTKHEAAAGAADDGFHEPAPGALDELSSKPEWADGSRRTAISQLDNELRDHPEARRAVFGHFMKHGGSEEAFDRIMHPENLAKLRAGQVPEELKAMAPGRVVLEAWKGGGEFAFLTSAVEGVRFDAPTLSEAAKGLRGDAIRSGAVERAAAAGHPAPKGARWIWLRASNARPDLQGEVVDVAMLKQYADYTVREGGWLDAEHYSRPERFPKWAADQGLTPQSFVLGKITALRFQDEDVWIEGYFYPEGVSTIADDYWNQLQAVPSMFHVSIGGPVLAPRTPVMVDGRRFLKLQMVMNHAALCMQAVNPHGTRVFTGPAGPFSEAMKAGAFAVGDFRDLVQAVVEGVPEQPDCDGESCVACFTRGETLKSVVSGGPDGINEQGIVPQDLEGARDLAPGDDEDEDEGEAQGEEAEKSLFAAGGGFDSPAAAMRYLQACGIPSHLAEQHVGKFWS